MDHHARETWPLGGDGANEGGTNEGHYMMSLERESAKGQKTLALKNKI